MIVADLVKEWQLNREGLAGLETCRADILLLAVVKGKVSLEADGFQGDLSSGQLLMLNQEKRSFFLRGKMPTTVVMLGISGDMPGEVLELLKEGKIFCPKGGLHTKLTIHSLEDAAGDGEKEKSRVSAILYQLLMELYSEAEVFQTKETYPELVEAALEIMNEEYADLDGVGEIADRLGITLPYFVRLFSRNLGQSPGKYLKERRLAYARQLLEETDIPVSLVTQLSGFSGANYFAKVFRRAYGISPSQYREAHGGRKGEEGSGLEDMLYLS